ncbi:MAG: T9SS type A sorting domain-containing protein [Flavobacteriaceae bacterium]|nr:T9SS type A sorting domain-containing protein [Flavobacteriaceae bacterium]
MNKLLYSFIFLIFLHFGNSALSQPFNNEPVLAYPNPAKEFLYVKTTDPNLKIKFVSFYSILGNKVADISINASYSEIRIDKLKSGKYLMKYSLSDDTQKIIQIIKQ